MLKTVIVYDGPQVIKAHEDRAEGDYTSGLHPESVLVLDDNPEVQFGIQLFLESHNRNDATKSPMTFCGFGADFFP